MINGCEDKTGQTGYIGRKTGGRATFMCTHKGGKKNRGGTNEGDASEKKLNIQSNDYCHLTYTDRFFSKIGFVENRNFV
jgi:hypothetical protein